MRVSRSMARFESGWAPRTKLKNVTYYLEVNNTPKELQDFANLYQQKLGKHMGKDAKSAVVLGSGER